MSKITSKYYSDYSYEKNVYSQYTAYNLTAPKDSVKTGLLSTKQMETYGTKECKIKDKAEYFKNQLETADSFTDRIVSAIVTNIPGTTGQSLAITALIEAIVTAKEEPSAKNILNAILSALEGTPIISLPIAVVEVIAYAPVVWTNLYNCRGTIDRIQELI